MTVATSGIPARAAGNGVSTVYAFTFKIFAATDLVVRDIVDATGVPTTKTLTTDYSVTISATEEGGSVTFVTAPAAGHTVDIRSVIPLTQPVDIRNQGRFLPEIHEGEFDRLERQIQDTRRIAESGIHFPDYEVARDMSMPALAAAAGKYVALDALGRPVASVGTGNDSALRTDLAATASGSDGSRLSGFRRTEAGSVARSVFQKLSESVYVEDFGAVGGGVVDDTAAIQAAINAVPAGGEVNLAGTSYKTTATLTIGNKIKLKLSPRTVLVLAQTPPTLGINVTAGGAGSVIEGGSIQTANTGSGAIEFTMVTLTLTSFVKVLGVRFLGGGAGTDPVNPLVGINVDRTTDCEIAFNTIGGCNHGVRLIDTVVGASNPARNHIHHNKIPDAPGPNNGGYGVLLVRAQGNIVDHNLIGPGPIGRHGVYVSAGSRANIVDNNVVKASNLAGISMNSGVTAGEELWDNSITNNTVYGPASVVAFSYGINATGAIWRTRMIGNAIVDAGVSGIYVQGNALGSPTEWICALNSIYNAQQGGIDFEDGLRCLIANNSIIDGGQQAANTYAGIVISPLVAAAANNRVTGNKIKGARFSWAVVVAAGSTDTVVNDNDMIGVTRVPPLNDSGTRTMRRNNKYANAASEGTAALVAGTVTVNTTEVDANDTIVLTGNGAANAGALYVTTITAQTSFVIVSTNVADARTVAWKIVH